MNEFWIFSDISETKRVTRDQRGVKLILSISFARLSHLQSCCELVSSVVNVNVKLCVENAQSIDSIERGGTTEWWQADVLIKSKFLKSSS